jgi:uncharacterized protein YijF (DUF1287 family)
MLLFGVGACGEAALKAQSSHAQTIGSTLQTPPFRPQIIKPKIIQPSAKAAPLVKAARDRLSALVVYDGRYVGLDYPGGDVPATIGVCTDVVIRSYRAAYGFDFQKAVHEDIRQNFSVYPTTWRHSRADKNIDHRRVPNLEVWFTRAGHNLPITAIAADYLPGDVVSWRLDGGAGGNGLPHTGIVSDRVSAAGTPLIIHNIGRGPEESDMLFDHTIKGHFRFLPESAL